jgi:hypothetical protein
MNSFTAFLLVALVATAVNAASFSVLSEDVQWSAWKTFHQKTYEDEYEEGFRRAIWVYNLKVCSQELNKCQYVV